MMMIIIIKVTVHVILLLFSIYLFTTVWLIKMINI